MTAQIVPLRKEQHLHLRILDTPPFQHVQQEHLLPVVLHEFPQLAAEHPVVFVKHAETGQFQPVALVGLAAGQNLFCHGDQWLASYIPRVVLNYPMLLTPDPDNPEQLLVGIDQASDRVSSVEGEALFTPDGDESAYLQHRKQQLSEFFHHSRQTQDIVARFAELSLLQPRQLTISVNGESRDINGLYLIDEQALNALPEAAFLELRKQGYLAAIYAHLFSIQHIQQITQRLAKGQRPSSDAQ